MTVRRRDRVRRQVGSIAVDAFFRGASRVGRMHPRARPGLHRVQVVRDLVYRRTRSMPLCLDVYRPLDPPPRFRGHDGRNPIVVYVHGGGFRILSKDTHWLPALAFARHGYTVFNVDYRLAPRHPFPAALQDVCDAVSWIAEHAEAWGCDPERMVLAGESAGANLVTSTALCIAYDWEEPWARRLVELGVRPRAVLAAMGLFQVSDPHRFGRRRQLPRWLEDRILEVSEAYLPNGQSHPLADPVLHLERGGYPNRPLPPFYVPCGTRDPLLDDTRRLGAALKELGVRCEVKVFPGEVHAFHVFPWSRAAKSCWQEMLAFADEQSMVAPRAPRATRLASRRSELFRSPGSA